MQKALNEASLNLKEQIEGVNKISEPLVEKFHEYLENFKQISEPLVEALRDVRDKIPKIDSGNVSFSTLHSFPQHVSNFTVDDCNFYKTIFVIIE